MTPSETLVAAADLIRDLAAKATKGEWLSNFHYVDSMPELYVRHPVCTAAGEGDARWIAALPPALAGPLEAIFRFAALAHRLDNPGTQDESALALAKAILGSGATP